MRTYIHMHILTFFIFIEKTDYNLFIAFLVYCIFIFSDVKKVFSFSISVVFFTSLKLYAHCKFQRATAIRYYSDIIRKLLLRHFTILLAYANVTKNSLQTCTNNLHKCLTVTRTSVQSVRMCA